jgi:hypothetical protein
MLLVAILDMLPSLYGWNRGIVREALGVLVVTRISLGKSVDAYRCCEKL